MNRTGCLFMVGVVMMLTALLLPRFVVIPLIWLPMLFVVGFLIMVLAFRKAEKDHDE